MSNENNSLERAYKKKRLFDQMASMHFKLSDRYQIISKVEDSVEIIVSVALCGLTFFDFEKIFCIKLIQPTLIIGFVSIFLFAFTLIKQQLDFKKRSEKHYLAGKMYARAKLEVASKIDEWEVDGSDELEIIKYFQENFSEFNELPQIPEKDFVKLKHAHQTKVEFSKFLDTHRRDYLWICKLKFRFGKKDISKQEQTADKNSDSKEEN